MRKSVCVLLCVLISVFSSHISAQKVIAKSETVIPVAATENGVTGDFLHPDFAYPQDVIKTAEAFLKANSTNDPNTVLALSEIVTARNSIDSKDKAPNVQLIFDLVNKVTDKATRSMLWLYGAQMCKYYGRQRSWWADDIKVRGDDVTKWEADDYAAAGDSLYMLALDNAPSDVPLSRFADALDATRQAYSFLPSVRDFVLYSIWKDDNVYSDTIARTILDKIVIYSPLWYYTKAQSFGGLYYKDSFEKSKAFISENIGKQNSEYAVYVFAQKSYRYPEIANEGDFIGKLADTYRYTWVGSAIGALLDYCNQSAWILQLEGRCTPGDIAKFTLLSTRTDTVGFELARYKTAGIPENSQKLSQYYSVSDRPVGKPLARQKLIFDPHSGYAIDTTVIDIVNEPGNYYVDGKYVYSSMPWVMGAVYTDKGYVLMALDAITGEPVKGIEVIYGERPKSDVSKVVTDKNGIAVLKDVDDIDKVQILESRDPKTGLSFRINFRNNYRYSGFFDLRENNDKKIKYDVTFDRPVYRPGDTVRWTLVATENSGCVVTNASTKVSLYLPMPGGGIERDPVAAMDIESVDKFGRYEGKFKIPEDAAIGEGMVTAGIRSFYFKISDFKLPDLNISGLQSTIQGDSVFISGRVTNSASAGRSGIAVKIEVRYPLESYNFSLLKDSLITGNNGDFSIKVPRIWAGSDGDDDDEGRTRPVDDPFSYKDTPFGKCLEIAPEARVSVTATSPDGYNATGWDNFETVANSAVYISGPEEVNAVKGAQFDIEVKDFRAYESRDSLSVRWVVTDSDTTVVLSGRSRPGILALTPDMLGDLKNARYYLWAISDNEPAQCGSYSFIVYDTKKIDLPVSSATHIWMPSGAHFDSQTGKAEVEIGLAKDDTYVWWCAPKDKSPIGSTVTGRKLSKGFAKIEITVPEALRDAEKVVLEFWTVKDGNYTSISYVLEVENGKKKLNLSLESFRDRLVPGASEKWQFVTRIGDKPVSAAVYANLYNDQLRSFGEVKVPTFIKRESVIPWYKFGFGSTSSQFYNKWISNRKPEFKAAPEALGVGWKYFIGNRTSVYSRVSAMRADNTNAAPCEMEAVKQKSIISESSADVDEVEMEDMVVCGYGTVRKSVNDLNNSLESIPLRMNNVLNALWAPMLTTDATTGTVDVEFTVPNQSSTWVLKASAWTTDLQYAVFSHTFTAVKPVIVAPNPPRFVRVGDTVNLVTAITNTTDSVADISYSVNIGGSDIGGTVRLDGGATRYVTTPVSITGDVALLDSLALTIRATNGVFGDGERVAVPVLPSSALVVESRNFYLNPTEAAYTAEIPSGDDSESELHFTANPMWVVVESLPSVLDEPCFEVSTAYAQSLYVAKTALKIAEGHPAAKSTIDVTAAKQSRKTAVEKLSALQTKDGGLRWGEWQTSASMSATLNFLGWMDQDTDDADIKKIVGKALEYVDNHIYERTGATIRPDLHYSCVRSAYGTPTTLAGRQVVDATLNHVRKNWRGFGLSDKALAVTLLYRTGNKALAKTILASISQFGKITSDRGMVFPNMPGIVGYANLLEAYGLVLPDAPETDAIRQGLIAQRRGASWGKSAHTSYAVRAMVSTGTDWTVPAEPFTVIVDGKTVDLAPGSTLTGAVSVAVKGSEVAIERQAGVPAYGAVVTRRVAPLTDIAAFSDGEVAIEKNLYRKDRAGNYVLLTDDLPKPGEKVTVRLTLTAKADMTDLVVTDLRPAAFEPVDQTGRYSHSGTGLWFYLANRDTQTEIYIDRLPRGRHIVEYEVTVNNTGTFTTGMATITSGIDPDLTAHSASAPLSLPE